MHCVANVGLRKRLNLFKRGFKTYDLLVQLFWQASSVNCPISLASNSMLCRCCSLWGLINNNNDDDNIDDDDDNDNKIIFEEKADGKEGNVSKTL